VNDPADWRLTELRVVGDLVPKNSTEGTIVLMIQDYGSNRDPTPDPVMNPKKNEMAGMQFFGKIGEVIIGTCFVKVYVQMSRLHQ